MRFCILYRNGKSTAAFTDSECFHDCKYDTTLKVRNMGEIEPKSV